MPKRLECVTPTSYTDSTFPEVIPCAKGCRNGELDLRFMVEHWIENQKEEYDHSFFCDGRELRTIRPGCRS